MPKNKRLAIFAHHPIYYQTPIFREFAKKYSNEVELTIYFGSDISLKPTYFNEIQTSFKPNYPHLLEGFDYTFLKNFTLFGKKGFFSRINFGILWKLILKKQDVILIHGYETLTSWLILFFAKLTFTPVIWRGEAVFRGNETSKTLKAIVKKIALTFFFSLCNHILYSCQGNRKYLLFYGANPKKMSLIPCAVDNDFHKKQVLSNEEKIKAKEELSIASEKIVLIFIARFAKRKRPLDLANAVAKMKNKEQVTILYVGDGPEMPLLKEQVEKNKIDVRFLGFKNQTQIPKYYSIADLSIVISDHDPSPKTLNEAMTYKLGFIVTDVIGTAGDLVIDNYNGYIVKVGDIETIANKLDELVENKSKISLFGENSYKLLDEWNLEKDADAIYNACLKLQ